MNTNNQDSISVNPLIDALLKAYTTGKEQPLPSEQHAIKVSRTVSFLAFIYEKIRNAVEYKEDHLIRRAAIERILKRRLILNGEGKGIAEPIIKELLWARYLPNQSIPESKISVVQKSIDKYLYLRRAVVPGRPSKELGKLDQFILELLSCEIEEILAPAPEREAFINFVYQSILNLVDITDKKLIPEKNILVYVATEQGFAKSDIPLVRYHLTKILLPELTEHNLAVPTNALPHFMQVYNHIENTFKQGIIIKLRRFVKKNSAPYLVLRDLIESRIKEASHILKSETELRFRVDEICRKRYQESRSKLTRAGVRSIIYIFLTKMVLAILLEYPIDKYLQQQVSLLPLSINIVFPPFLMFIMVIITGVPGADNTKRIYERILTIINTDIKPPEKTIIKDRSITKRPLLAFGFSIIYLLAFILTFGVIFFGLSLLKFNIASQLIFIFFVSLVLFFAYRIRQTAKEYLLVEKEGILSPVKDFFTLPILSLGKWLSSEIGKLNIFIFIFDFIIEAPFKAIFEIGEEWINFMKSKKEEFT